MTWERGQQQARSLPDVVARVLRLPNGFSTWYYRPSNMSLCGYISFVDFARHMLILERNMPVVDHVTRRVRDPMSLLAVNRHVLSTKLAEPPKSTANAIPGL